MQLVNISHRARLDAMRFLGYSVQNSSRSAGRQNLGHILVG